MPFSVPQQIPYNAISLSLYQVDSFCGLGPDLVSIHSISLATRYRIAACSSHFAGLEKVSAARGHNRTPLFALSSAWEDEFLLPSMDFNNANAFEIICRLDRDDTLGDVPQNKQQKASTVLLLGKLHKQDLTGPLACRASCSTLKSE